MAAASRGRIAYLTSNPIDGRGGEERFTRDLAHGLELRGWEVRVIDPGSIAGGNSRAGSIVDRYLRLPEVRRSWRVCREYRRTESTFDLVIVNSLAGWAARARPGIVIYHGTGVGYSGALRQKLGMLPYLKWRYVGRHFETWSGKGRYLVGVSESTKYELETHYDIRVHAVIPGGTNVERFRPRAEGVQIRRELGLPTDSFLALFTGRPGWHKGTDILDHVASGLTSEIKVVAAVPIDYDAHPNIVKLVGLPETELPLLYSACDAFILPSRWEACSQSLIEALASGLPPVVSRVGSVPGLLAREPALSEIAPATWEPSAYIDALHRLSCDDGFRTYVAGICRCYAESEHSLAKVVDRYDELLGQLIKSRVRGT